MLAPLTLTLVVLLAALAVYALYLTVRGRAIDNAMFYLACACEVAIVVQLVVGVVQAGSAEGHLSTGLFIAYLVGLIFVLPVAGFWGVAERESRWGTGVILVAALGLLVMVARLLQLWNGNG